MKPSLNDLLNKTTETGGRQSTPAFLSRSKAYKVYEDHDKEEGRGGRTMRFVVTSRGDATLLAAGLGPQGTLGHIEEVDNLVIEVAGYKFTVPFNAVAERTEDRKATLRAAALLKLTPEERAAVLG